MLRLTLEGHEIDLYEDVSVNLTLQFANVQNVNAPAGSFSQTFRVPATDNNLDYFGPITDSTSVDIVNVKQRLPAQIFSDSIPILSGFCQIKAIYLQKERYADIELVFFGEALDLKSAVGDAFISDLDLSALDHEVNRDNIEDSWTASTGIAPYIRYGIIDRGNNWSNDNRPWLPSQGIYQNQLTPFVSVYKILDAIIDEAGFTWESDFLGDPATTSSTSRNMYVPCLNGQQNTTVVDGTGDDRVKAYLDGDVVSSQGSGATGILDILDNIDDGFDPGDNWNNTTYRYTCPRSALYSFRLRLVGELGLKYQGIGPHQLTVTCYKNGSAFFTMYNDSIIQPGATFGEYINTEIVFEGEDALELASGDNIDFRYALNNDAEIHGDGTRAVRTYVEVTEISPALSGFDVDIASSLPKMKQIDFIVGIQRMFNLVIIPDKNKPNHLLIEPFQDYIGTGTDKDWTSFVDYSKDVTIKPTTDLQKKETTWTYKPGLDFVSDAVQKTLDRVYGEYKVTEPDNDFAQGDQKIETTFGQYLVSLIPGFSFLIHRSLTSDGTAVQEPLPMIAYWSGLSDIGGNWFMEEDIGVTPTPVEFSTFPFWSNYSTASPGVTDKDLNFGMESPFFNITVNPAQTLYFEYWAQYVTELYADEARIMTCTMRLDKREIADFEFSDNIYIRDSYWRVLSITYDGNVEGTCSVELIKILSDVSICEDTPTGYQTRYNFILFNNSTQTTPDYGSQKCCERYGYEWVIIPTGPTLPGATSPMGICKSKGQTSPPNS